MLPSLVATELLNSVSRFLKTSFPSTTPGFLRASGESAIDDFVATPGALFKGPYLSLGLPFRKLEDGADLPLRHFHPGFPPYRHQMAAFERLCGHQPLPTLVATGTGSGKTECFMYPVLDHCLEQTVPGVKAIIIYPMNALATDQARRFAKEIHGRDALRGRVRVGLFVGDNDESPFTEMTPDYVITCKNTQRDNPPDILLTNYKMLDYLLIRPKDQPLWRFNEPGRLRYLVVDELHTFDGAQGTDLACLIRRLRARMQCEQELACVGTSATIGGESSVPNLTAYAGQVFATHFDEQSVIMEDRLSPSEFLPSAAAETRWPDAGLLKSMGPERYGSIDDYIAAHAQLWFAEPPRNLTSQNARQRDIAAVELGDRLKSHTAFQELLRRCEGISEIRTLLADWQQQLRIGADESEALLNSLVALISTARSWRQPHLAHPEEGGTAPFLQVRSQLWLRELRRLVASVDSEPVLRMSDDLALNQEKLHLPAAHCRECQSTAWATVRAPNQSQVSRDLNAIYGGWFGQHPDTLVLVPLPTGQAINRGPVRKLCGRCGHLGSDSMQSCPECDAAGDIIQRVWQADTNREHQQNGATQVRFHNDCPQCGAVNALMLMGSRAASLASVMISQLYGSVFNDDHKLIAFSDSVQDAAHRAGFFEARTWRQSVRQALHQAIAQRLQEMPLPLVAEQFTEFWLDRLGPEAFAATFIAPNLEWLRDWEALRQKGQLPADSDLIPEWIRPRLNWEVISEFGLGSRIGRTLERTGRAVASPDLTRVQQAIRHALPELQERITELRDLDAERLQTFVIGLLWRLKVKGAFMHPVLEGYLREAGKDYQINRIPYMPGYGKAARPPAFLTMERLSNNFETIRSTSTSWYQNWFNKVLAADAVLATASLEQAFGIVLRALCRTEMLTEHDVRGHTVWTLNPWHWTCSTQVVDLGCDKCHNRIQASASQLSMWQGLDCQRNGCTGHYSDASFSGSPTTTFKPPVRLVTSEHTGLLPPDTRLDIENSFKKGTQPWDINLLSATPTMEMGIDIGDLSSVLLCSVPPAQANYLQRIGRAGRKDGNALTIAVANGVPHDLYFYADPMEMMAGSVGTPGVYLSASAVLERQLIAFSFDQWTQTGIDDSAIPATIGTILNGLKSGNPAVFPQNLLTFIERERSRLFREFTQLFPELETDAANREHLEAFLFGNENGDIGYRLRNRLLELVKQRDSLQSRIGELKKSLDELKKRPQDETTQALIDETSGERNGLFELIKAINRKQTLNFFTDEGLLPNYAFPEEGVKLQSVIFRRLEQKEQPQEEDDSTGRRHSKYEKQVFEFTRPSSAALSELAPEGRFYGGGRQVEIDQIDLNLSSAEHWRLCNQCHYAESLIEGDMNERCPRCSSEMWRNSSQKQTLMKLRQVFANTSDRESRIGDDSEQREPIFFNRQLLVNIPKGATQKAYRLVDEGLPFGFEYLKTATFREVNFGRAGDDGLEFEVAGRQARRPGFRICRHCGKVQKRKNDPRLNHSISCRMRKPGAVATDDDFYNTLYLYRELNSEAVRLLLPIAEVQSSDVRLQSLVAALHLGLKAYFGGDVSHLQITSYSEPEGGGDLRRHYLVILDTVPGGTGYLKQLLLSPNTLIGMLQAAYDRLQQCSCNENSEADGCYRCLYAYRESRNLDLISRRSAVDLVGQILAKSDQIEEVEQLDAIDLNALHESELEQRFIETLANIGAQYQLTKTSVNAKPGYSLSIRRPDEKVVIWHIEPQVKLGPANGVSLYTEADFVLWPTSSKDLVKPVAIYLDGYAYHRDIVKADTTKRQAIWQSGQFLVWSLNWDDLPKKGYADEHPEAEWLCHPLQPESLPRYNQLAEKAGWPAFLQSQDILQRGSFHWLLGYLSEDAKQIDALTAAARSRVITALDFSCLKSTERRSSLIELATTLSPAGWQALHLENALPGVGTAFQIPQFSLVASVAPSSLGKTSTLIEDLSVLLYLDDSNTEHVDFKQVWRRFWAATNLFQFVSHSLFVTRSGVALGSYEDLIGVASAAASSPTDTSGAELDESWIEALELTAFAEELAFFSGRGFPAPVVGEDWRDADQVVVGEIEWCWPEPKLALVVDNATLTAALRALEWRVIEDTEQLEALSLWLAETTGSHDK